MGREGPSVSPRVFQDLVRQGSLCSELTLQVEIGCLMSGLVRDEDREDSSWIVINLSPKRWVDNDTWQ